MLVYECFVIQMYVCVLCASGGRSQCCILHDLQFVNVGQGCKRQPYGRSICLNPFVMVLFSVCSAVTVECCVL